MLLVLLAFLLVAVGTQSPRRLAAEALLAALALAAARAPVAWVLKRSLLLAPFALAAAASGFFAPAGALLPGMRAAQLLARMAICFAALAAAARALGPAEMLAGMARLRLPPLLVSVAALMLRYLGLLEAEAERMLRARDLRGAPPRVAERARVAGVMVGTLFVRSMERAERVSYAMQARGFTGLMPPPAPARLDARSTLFLGASLLALAAACWL